MSQGYSTATPVSGSWSCTRWFRNSVCEMLRRVTDTGIILINVDIILRLKGFENP